MNDQFAWWLLILGIAIGVGLVWLVTGRLPREDADVDDDERALEAAWISRTIAASGGEAPEPLVEEILELHRRYLAGPAFDPLHPRFGDEADPAEDDPGAVDDGIRGRTPSTGTVREA
jgi:hypothetical protein